MPRPSRFRGRTRSRAGTRKGTSGRTRRGTPSRTRATALLCALVLLLGLSGCSAVKKAAGKKSPSPSASASPSGDAAKVTEDHAAAYRDPDTGKLLTADEAKDPKRVQDVLKRYWTPERVAAAIAATGPVGGAPEPSSAATAGPVDDPGHEQISGPAAAPGGGSVGRASPVLPSAGGAIPNASGKLFFHVPGGRDGTCSAAAVNSASRRLLATAGHCVHGGKGGQWMENTMFVAGYRGGTALNFTAAFPAYQSRTFTAWIQEGSQVKYTTERAFTHDVAFITTMNGFDGRRIVDKYGGYGIRTGPYPISPTSVRLLGYPDAFDKGGVEQECVSDVRLDKARIAVDCGMGPGSSGGPWVWKFPNVGWIVGVTSTGAIRPAIEQSARFGSDVWTMFQAQAGTAP
ncbi:trypsin-like serine peptidase [Yinghuangia seranimata]|uniref:trypsin-like serine peptidase n=1 Tax=Yinghuangia seranimata TaxID=408067 RepID=UPI00248CB116|nr:hypothetical protein [Yinghuangia seranimata]MDI2125241.1 hypothetical protein [Yinghuangia seranimata]